MPASGEEVKLPMIDCTVTLRGGGCGRLKLSLLHFQEDTEQNTLGRREEGGGGGEGAREEKPLQGWGECIDGKVVDETQVHGLDLPH